ncbi:MAG: peptide ABC transporter substrate-binding protein [Anaerolineales bacterium]|nr:peptide ABC transporter substrate-binding protein [Anaerolineales bacterium]MCB8952380.1 peptide ABC transporter substrate-binding protein [Ardenticatenales bacterium]
MLSYKRFALIVAILAMGVLILAACQPEVVKETVEVTRVVTEEVMVEGQAQEVTRVVVEQVEVTPTPALVPAEPKNLIVCMAQEPETLYVYGGNMLAQSAVLHAIYENDVTTLSYAYQAQGVEKIPSIADGDAYFETVTVNAGDKVMDKDNNPTTLEEGLVVLNANGDEVTFDGSTPVEMKQMVVEMTMKPRIWSDGTPVTADDSVYSYELAVDPDTPRGKFQVDRTASYEAKDDLTTIWRGLPGFVDSQYYLNGPANWPVLPRHAWSGFTASELLEAEQSSRMPMGDGAFMVTEWIAGDHITLVKNPNYYRASEGLPYLDSVTYKFVPDTNQLIAQLLAGQCDIGTQDGMDVTQAPFLIEAENSGILVPYFQTGTVFEHIDFNIDPWDSTARGGDRIIWFDDVRVRQAMTMCTDRQSMVDNILYGRSEVISSYIPSVHPLFNQDNKQWPYDVDAANKLLDDAGFLDTDGDGIRNHPTTGENFKVNLGTTSGNEMRQQLTQIFKENMIQCGIDIELEYLPASEWFADGPDGPLFGRTFDLGEFAWLTGVDPSCNLYITDEIPGPPEEGYKAGWGGSNETGWSNADYDVACKAALASLPGTPEYEQYHKQAQLIFSENVPVIPLFLRLKVAAARPEVLNFGVDPTQNSELYNIFEIDLKQP